MARPTIDISKETLNDIFDDLATSNVSFAKICENHDVCFVTLWRHMSKDEDLCNRYARSKEMQMDYLSEDILVIADDADADKILYDNTVTGKKECYVDHEVVQRSRLRVDTRKWLMSKLKSKKYGDKLDVAHTGGIQVNFNIARPPKKDEDEKAE